MRFKKIGFGLHSGAPVPFIFFIDQIKMHLYSKTFSHEHQSLFSPTINLIIKIINPIYLIFVIELSTVRNPERVFHTILCKLTFRCSYFFCM